MTRYPLPILFMLVLIAGSCQSIEQITIDYMVPAEVSFPANLRKVAIVNNTTSTSEGKWAETNPKEENEVSRFFAFHQGKAKIVTESLAQAIADENYFDEVVICDSALRQNDIFNRESTLSQTEVQELTKKLDVDFLIALEAVQLNATKSIQFIPIESCLLGTIDVKIYPSVKIYVPSRKSPMLTINSKDSIFWEEAGSTEQQLHTHLIKDEQMVKEASLYAGTIPVKHIIPSWKTSNRYFYNGSSPNMRDAALFAFKNAWDNAFKLWDSEFKKVTNPKKKMRAAYNIALYYEVKDSIPQAVVWATQAQKLAREVDKIEKKEKKTAGKVDLTTVPNYVLSTIYLGELNNRESNLSKLKMQMDRFSDVF